MYRFGFNNQEKYYRWSEMPDDLLEIQTGDTTFYYSPYQDKCYKKVDFNRFQLQAYKTYKIDKQDFHIRPIKGRMTESELKMKEPERYIDSTTGQYVDSPTERTIKVDPTDYTPLEWLKAAIDKLDVLQSFADRQSVHG